MLGDKITVLGGSTVKRTWFGVDKAQYALTEREELWQREHNGDWSIVNEPPNTVHPLKPPKVAHSLLPELTFNKGELSPVLEARTPTKLLDSFRMDLDEAGIPQRRPGTKFIARLPGEPVACALFDGKVIVSFKDVGPHWYDLTTGEWGPIEFQPEKPPE